VLSIIVIIILFQLVFYTSICAWSMNVMKMYLGQQDVVIYTVRSRCQIAKISSNRPLLKQI